ncbi:MAG: hypothetical protein AMK71_10335 [Nitrospira bacterium SG8_35_4]|nr:MAG: hypothetical protein AMK71_10335 [Nitrospira bacterium SG8_35_4]
MRKPLILILVVLLPALLLFPASQPEAADQSLLTDAILDSAERFFLSLKERDFETAWNTLSEKSRESIIHDIYEASVTIGGTLRREDIIRDFERRGVIFRNYWTSFLRTFDADLVLEQGLWKMGAIKETKAEIIIQFNKFSNPTILRMLKEDETWKVGLNETFSRGAIEKWLDILKKMYGV